MKLDKIYTRTGDEGKTSLGDGSRLPKFHLRVTAYGSIDEANSVIGVANLHVANPEVLQLLRHIQNDLFDVGADLVPAGAARRGKAIAAHHGRTGHVAGKSDRPVQRGPGAAE